jgi:hypothetical protein
MSTYYIIDARHGLGIAAGDRADNNLYHQDPAGRQNARWVLESAGDGDYYHIKDAQHGLCIVAGDSYDGYLYHQPANARLNAQWRVVEIKGAAGLVTAQLFDRKHGKAIVAGDTPDNHVYHQDPGDRPNARWQLIPADAVDPKLPIVGRLPPPPR